MIGTDAQRQMHIATLAVFMSLTQNKSNKCSRKKCPHGRQRYDCRSCNGAGYCIHNRRRRICRDCNGSSFCTHGKRRRTCRPCGGSDFCTHGRRRQQCKECNGSSICKHGKQRHGCKECNGSSICIHGRQRHDCKECCGSSICMHNSNRRWCRYCNPASLCAGEACSIFDVSERRLGVKDGLCWTCWNAAHPTLARSKVRIEHMVLAEVERLLPELQKEACDVVWDCAIHGVTDCTLRKPDMLWVFATDNGDRHSLHLEVDETNDHEDDDVRVADIQKATESLHHYLVRVRMQGAFRRKRLSNGEPCVYAADSFDSLMVRLMSVLRERWDSVKSGTAPTAKTWKTVVAL